MSIGGSVNVGVVFRENDHIQIFQSFVNSLKKREVSFKKVKYSIDPDGENWIEQSISKNIIEDSYLSGHYTEFEVLNLLNSSKPVRLTIHIEDGYFGFLLDFNWEEVASQEVFILQNQMLQFLIELYQDLSYHHAFIGHEIEVDVHPDDFEDFIGEADYPVGIIGKTDKLAIYYGSVGMDGLSAQTKRTELVNL
ncbi:Imm64 family immunity protein [Bacillus safensis]|uniref:Imm64 family immunity protein n=1 Tax=Bacillus safensis TaxID=561879 RepID=UPI002E1D5C0F|nr:Imm64 family immunity protein [Bacillus safensis]